MASWIFSSIVTNFVLFSVCILEPNFCGMMMKTKSHWRKLRNWISFVSESISNSFIFFSIILNFLKKKFFLKRKKKRKTLRFLISNNQHKLCFQLLVLQKFELQVRFQIHHESLMQPLFQLLHLGLY